MNQSLHPIIFRLDIHFWLQIYLYFIICIPYTHDQKLKSYCSHLRVHILGESSPSVKTEMPEDAKERRKKSRWSTTKSFVPGMPTILPSNLDENQRQAYLRKYFCIFEKLNLRSWGKFIYFYFEIFNLYSYMIMLCI